MTGAGVLVTLSERGRDAVDAAFTDLLDREQSLLSRLVPGQRDQLAGLLRTLLVPFDEGAHPRGARRRVKPRRAAARVRRDRGRRPMS